MFPLWFLSWSQSAMRAIRYGAVEEDGITTIKKSQSAMRAIRYGDDTFRIGYIVGGMSQSAMRAIRYGESYQRFRYLNNLCRNPLCVQLDMEFNDSKDNCFKEGLSQSAMRAIRYGEISSSSVTLSVYVAIRYACN